MADVIRLLNVTSSPFLRDDVTSEVFNEEYRKEPSVADVAVEFLWKNTSQGLRVDGYVLRLPYDMVDDVAPGCFAREKTGRCGSQTDGLSTDCPGNEALTSGLLSLQWAVETALIRTFKDPGFEPLALQVQMLPVPFYRPGATNTQLLVCVCMVIALAPLAYFVTVTIVTEQKSGAKVMLKVMGIRESVFWLSWWLTYTVTVALVSVAVTVMLALAGFLGSAGLGFVFLLLLLYGFSIIALSFLLAVCFTSPQVGGLTSSLLTILQGLLYLAVSLTRPSTPLSLTPSPLTSMTPSAVPFAAQVVLSLSSPVALMLGLDQAIFDHEQGVNSHIVSGQFPLLSAVLMLILDTALYGCLAVYLHIVVPDQYRLPRKPWFCFTPSYWRCRDDEARDSDVIPCDVPEGPHIEPMSEAQMEVRAIRIRDISKKFTCGKNEPVYGLNGLDLDIYEGQITCVLGHPGAGKTTLLNILAGVMQPISGVAYIYDLNACDVQDHKELVKTVSYCPQYDVIPDDVTVEEHLQMAAFLRGMKVEGLEDMVTGCLKDVGLHGDRQRRAGQLSASHRRRLSLAVALLADTKVLLLDEPTRGLEGEERQRIWELLHTQKDMRVIVCTTRHMEEARYLADRTVVLSRGRLRSVGSTQFLRQQFNVAYLLSVTIKSGSSSDRLLRAVKSHMREASLVRCDPTTVTIMLPLTQAARMTGLLKVLESKDRGAEYLGITEFTLTMTSLEQVFWKIAEEEEAGHVFISPLLTPSDDVFTFDDVKGDAGPRDSVLVPSSQLDDLSRRFSVFPAARQLGLLDVDDVNNRRKSAHPRLQDRADAGRRDDKAVGSPGGGGISRRLSSLFARSPAQEKKRHSSMDHLAPPSPHRHPTTADPAVHRRVTLFADALLKRRKDGSRSPVLAHLKKSHTSLTLNTMTSAASDATGVEESSAHFTGGSILPTSLAERRVTVAAFKDFRRSMSMQSNLSGLSSLGDHNPITPPDPMSRLNVLDSFDLRGGGRTPSLSKNSSFHSTRHSTCSSLAEELEEETPTETGTGVAATKDTESAAPAHPAKIGEVLANLKPLKTGVGLGLQRLGAMLRLRVWLLGRAKCWLLLRLLLPALVAGLGVALAHSTQHLNPAPSQPGKRIHLFGIAHLMYRNQTGGDISSLESNFSRALDGPERMTHYSSDSWDPQQPLKSLLDVLQPDGSGYRLNYNSTCALALPHVTSFLAHVMRHSPTPTPPNPQNLAYLGSQLSAWLQPWPPKSALRSDRLWDWVPILFLGVALMLTPTHCAVRLVRERKAKLRTYIGVAGVSRVIYYGSCFIVDVIELLIAASLVVVICAATFSEVSMLGMEGAVKSLSLLLLLSVPGTTLMAYLASFCFSRAAACRVLMPLTFLLVTGAQFCLVHFLDRGDSEVLSTVLHYVFAILWPPYLRFGTLHYIAKTRDIDQTLTPVFPVQSHIDICYIMLLVDIIVLACLVLLLDKLTFRPPTLSCCGHGRKKSYLIDHTHSDDEGVTSEIQRVQDLQKGGNKDSWPWLIVREVSKVWTAHPSGSASKRGVKAVDGVTLAVDQGQVLALLGPPGAGKTTLLDLVLGLNPPSEGYISLEGGKVSCQTGYCPQYNPLWAPLTVDQHVQFVASLKGLHPHDLTNFRESLYYDLDLDSYKSHRIYQLSECEKRKLTFAMGMLGQQKSIMILDEPSSGMDPRSRRLYWDAVKHFLQNSERAAVISTHSAAEAKALCSRIALFVNGRLKHLGTPEELQHRCRQTFSLDVRFMGWKEGEEGRSQHQRRMDMLVLFLRELFPASLTLVEQFRERALFLVQCPSASSDFSLANIFDTLESIKRNLDLDEFTFSQYNVDQLFLDLARQQKHGDSRCLRPEDLHCQKPASPNTKAAPHLGSTAARPDVPVGVTSTDPVQQPRDEGGASCQDDVSDADAAVGMVVIHHSGADGGGGVACGEERGRGAAAAAPMVVFSVDGMDNLAFTTDGEDDAPETQTTL